MCGIAGTIGIPDRAVIEKMTTALSARGPDGAGTCFAERLGVGLGHRRLAVIDVSQAAAQPMSFCNGRYRAVFNGEIYNFAELRKDLEDQGVVFRTASDTEVLLAAYHLWGDACLERFIGMFAFAILDNGSEAKPPRMLLARDRLGIKPLLCYEKAGVFAFASELRALRHTGLLANSLQRESLLDYLATGSVLQPRTSVDGVWAMPPGSAMELRRGSGDQWVRREWQFWDLVSATTSLRHELSSISTDDAVAEVVRLLEEATRYHLVADVPVGSFLSGGVDSAGVTALMSRANGRPVETFTVGYRLSGRQDGELEAARATASCLGTTHRELTVDESLVAEAFQPWVRSLDQPSVDGLNTWIVSRFARKSVTVALSGLGGDEFFAGYPHFGFRNVTDRSENVAREAAITALTWLHGRIPNRFSLRGLQTLDDVPGRLERLRRPIPAQRVDSALRLAVQPKLEGRLRERLGSGSTSNLDAVQQTTHAESSTYLLSTLLRDADVMSMSHGLEVRPVLLHHPLVEFAFALPERLKMRAGDGKWILKRAIERICPLNFTGRAKRGFELPLAQWTVGALRKETEGALQSNSARMLLGNSYRESLLRNVRLGKASFELWAWLVLFSWADAERIELPTE